MVCLNLNGCKRRVSIRLLLKHSNSTHIYIYITLQDISQKNFVYRSATVKFFINAMSASGIQYNMPG